MYTGICGASSRLLSDVAPLLVDLFKGVVDPFWGTEVGAAL